MMLQGETPDANQVASAEANTLLKDFELIGTKVGSLTTGIGALGGLLQGLPLGPITKILNAMGTATGGVADQFLKVDAIASKMTQTFGVGKANIQQTKETLYDAGAELLTFSKSFDTVEEAMEAANKIASQYSATLNRSILLSKESIVDLQAVAEATGVGTDKLIPNFTKAGFQISRVKEEMKGVMNYAISMGVNVNAVASRVSDNLNQFNKYNFQNGVEGLTKMATQAAKLGVDMKNTFEMAERIMDPDEAIELSAALQRLGVTNSALLDPMKGMDMAQNSPEKIQEEMAKIMEGYAKLSEKSGKFEIIDSRKLREFAKQTKQNYDDLAQMALKGAEAKKILSEVSMPNITEEEQSLITSLAQFDKGSGEYKIKVGEEEKSVGLLTPKDFDELKKSVQPKEVEDVAKDQLSISQNLNRAIETLNKTQIEGILTNRALNETMQKFATGARNFSKDRVDKDIKLNKESTESQPSVRNVKTIDDAKIAGADKLTGKNGVVTSFTNAIDAAMEVQPAQDFIFRPGQDPLRFSEGDLVMGIDEESLGNSLNVKKPSEFREESFNNYKIPSESNDRSLDRFNEVKSQSQTITNIQQASGEITLNVVIKAEVPPGMDKEMFNTLITDTNVIQNIKSNIEKVSSNFNLTPKKSY